MMRYVVVILVLLGCVAGGWAQESYPDPYIDLEAAMAVAVPEIFAETGWAVYLSTRRIDVIHAVAQELRLRGFYTFNEYDRFLAILEILDRNIDQWAQEAGY